MEERELTNKIDYLVCCISEFSNKYSLTQAQAYAYLRRFNGIDFIVKHYAAEHTLSMENAIEDLASICRRHGGMLV